MVSLKRDTGRGGREFQAGVTLCRKKARAAEESSVREGWWEMRLKRQLGRSQSQKEDFVSHVGHGFPSKGNGKTGSALSKE